MKYKFESSELYLMSIFGLFFGLVAGINKSYGVFTFITLILCFCGIYCYINEKLTKKIKEVEK